MEIHVDVDVYHTRIYYNTSHVNTHVLYNNVYVPNESEHKHIWANLSKLKTLSHMYAQKLPGINEGSTDLLLGSPMTILGTPAFQAQFLIQTSMEGKADVVYGPPCGKVFVDSNVTSGTNRVRICRHYRHTKKRRPDHKFAKISVQLGLQIVRVTGIKPSMGVTQILQVAGQRINLLPQKYEQVWFISYDIWNDAFWIFWCPMPHVLIRSMGTCLCSWPR